MDSVQFKKYYTAVKNFLLGPKNKEFLIFLFFFFVSAVLLIFWKRHPTIHSRMPHYAAYCRSWLYLHTRLKDEEDREFAHRLFRNTLLNAEYYRKLISDNTKNWEFNRIALMDYPTIHSRMPHYAAYCRSWLYLHTRLMRHSTEYWELE